MAGGLGGVPPTSYFSPLLEERGRGEGTLRILALDVGEKRTGVAISDPMGIIASPLTTLEVRDGNLSPILNIISERGVERVVVGMPRSLDGSIGTQAQRVRDFMDRLRQATKVAIDEWDERLSTVAAQQALRAGGSKRAKQKARRDEIAAVIILQGYLDRIRSRGGEAT